MVINMTNLLSFVEEFQLTSTIGKVSIPFARLGCAVCHDELVLLEVFVLKFPSGHVSRVMLTLIVYPKSRTRLRADHINTAECHSCLTVPINSLQPKPQSLESWKYACEI